MGRRRSSGRKAVSKKKAKLQSVFKCPYCAHDNACEVKMDRVNRIGTITCRVCDEHFSSPINYLSDPVDVYAEWVDRAEEAQYEDADDEDEVKLRG